MKKHAKIEKGSGNVFLDLGFPPDEAHNLLIRSDLMIEIKRFVQKSGLTQKEAAKRLGLTQPRLNDLLRGKIAKFSLDALVNILARAGRQVALKVREAA
ncbi:MAG: helix-turn-helix transcriptional regulator [Nitrospirota bacterium]